VILKLWSHPCWCVYNVHGMNDDARANAL
jgi:hypothetical protein